MRCWSWGCDHDAGDVGWSIASEPRLRVVGIEEEIPHRCIMHPNHSMIGWDWYQGRASDTGSERVTVKDFWGKRRRHRSWRWVACGSTWLSVTPQKAGYGMVRPVMNRSGSKLRRTMHYIGETSTGERSSVPFVPKAEVLETDMIWRLESRFWTHFVLIMLHHVIHLQAINPYSIGSISAFSIISSSLKLLNLHQHQLAREFTPYSCCHHIISGTPTVNPTGV